MIRPISFLLLLLLLLLLGCGYHVPGHGGALPDGVETFYLPLFSNQTLKPRLENGLTDSIAEAISRIPSARLVSQEDLADVRVEGTILSYGSSAIAYDSNDTIKEYRAQMLAEVKLRKISDGRLVWQNRLAWQGPYLANSDKSLQNDLEEEAIQELEFRIAEEFLFRLLADF